MTRMTIASLLALLGAAGCQPAPTPGHTPAEIDARGDLYEDPRHPGDGGLFVEWMESEGPATLLIQAPAVASQLEITATLSGPEGRTSWRQVVSADADELMDVVLRPADDAPAGEGALSVRVRSLRDDGRPLDVHGVAPRPVSISGEVLSLAERPAPVESWDEDLGEYVIEAGGYPRATLRTTSSSNGAL
jgi:hypothetical protein